MRTVTEVLATSALYSRTVRCPFSNATNHSSLCACAGTGKVQACKFCEGSGWDKTRNNACTNCHGRGALAPVH